MSKTLSPCYNCTKRTMDCHSTCILYLDFRQKLDAINKIKEENSEIDKYLKVKRDKLKGDAYDKPKRVIYKNKAN